MTRIDPSTSVLSLSPNNQQQSKTEAEQPATEEDTPQQFHHAITTKFTGHFRSYGHGEAFSIHNFAGLVVGAKCNRSLFVSHLCIRYP